MRADHPVSDPELFELVFSAVPWPMLMLAEDGSVIAASDEALQRTAACWSPDGSLRDRVPQYLNQLRGNVPWLTPQAVECTRTLPSGVTIHERIHVRRTLWGSCLVIIDQTELRQAQSIDMQTARLAALGFMVASVCHELTNPLTSLQSVVQILRSEARPRKELLDKGLDNIAASVKRILDISRRLVTFSRVGDEPRCRFAVDEAIQEALYVLRHDGLLRGIEVDYVPLPVSSVFGNVGQIREILLNLMVNAIQAMSGAGRITINVRVEAATVLITISDTGPGIPEHAVSRIFEPFFTTKAGINGTGLGLAISAEIAREHGGSVELRHTSTAGTAFALALPVEAP
jgi:two-component system, NtrC family, sensor kinase